jgi:2Fe-2S ferredoxin
MVQVHYIAFDGSKRDIDVPVGVSVMEGAVDNRIRGIDGDCGGACACATCHVYVAPEWIDRLPPPNELERNMLKFALNPGEGSRLSCQIKVTPALEGLTVRLPESQY